MMRRSRPAPMRRVVSMSREIARIAPARFCAVEHPEQSAWDRRVSGQIWRGGKMRTLPSVMTPDRRLEARHRLQDALP